MILRKVFGPGDLANQPASSLKLLRHQDLIDSRYASRRRRRRCKTAVIRESATASIAIPRLRRSTDDQMPMTVVRRQIGDHPTLEPVP